MSDEDLKKLSQKLLETFQQEAANADQELCNKITTDLKEWSMDIDPIIAGKSFVIIRSWQQDLIKDDPIYRERKAIKIDPGVAFGLDDDSTLLAIEFIEDYWKGSTLLDVGTGTGVIAIAAALLQPNSNIDAFDISIDIVENASQNLEINGLLDKVTLKEDSITNYPLGGYDVVVANLFPDIFETIKLDLVRCLKANGKIILSGFSDQVREDSILNQNAVADFKSNDIVTTFQSLGLRLVEKRQLNSCFALLMQKN